MEKTYTTHEIKAEITKEILTKIKEDSQKENFRVKQNSSMYYDSNYLIGRAREIAFKSSKYKSKSNIYQNLLAANIAFPNEESFVQVLNSHGFTIEELNIVNNQEVSDKEKYKTLYKIAYTLKRYYGTIVTDLAMNRINEILVFNPELLMPEENTQIKPIIR